MIIQGLFDKISYIKPDNTAVYQIKSYSDDGFFVCEGEIPVLQPGTPVIARGDLKNGTFYSESIEIDGSVKEIMVDYLSSPLFEGIGKTLAGRIIDALNGQDLFEYIRKNDTLPEVGGLSVKRRDIILNAVKKTEYLRQFAVLCASYGIDYSTSVKIHLKYGEQAEKILKSEPYRLVRDRLLDFAAADTVASENEIPWDDKYRINALIFEVMYYFCNSGNTFVYLDELAKGVSYQSAKSAYECIVPPLLTLHRVNKLVIAEKLIWVENERTKIYLKTLYEAERRAAYETRRLCTAKKSETNLDIDIITEIEEEIGVAYEENQKQAFGVLYEPGVKIITGGPGTGKTTLIRGILQYIKKLGKTYALCAPTGRAAQRMTEVTGVNAVTIHKLLDIRPFGDNEYSCRGKEDPITADYIIVDEVSMVGIELYAKLVNAIKSGSTLLLVGDVDQLASVPPGNVLRDLINAGLETYSLEIVFRQNELSTIVKNAVTINHGVPELEEKDDFLMFRFRGSDYEAITSVAIKYFMQYYKKDDPFSATILIPLKKGDAGVHKVNTEVRGILNPDAPAGLTVGDQIIFLENNYEEQYYNGDIGLIEDMTASSFTVKMADKTLELPKECLKDATLSYALTIHKSQGSEYENVVIILPKTGMLAKNLLYTAVTRAKKRVILLYEEECLAKCITTDRTGKRNSCLAGLLNATYEQYCSKKQLYLFKRRC